VEDFVITRFRHSGFRVGMRKQSNQLYMEDIKRIIKNEMVDDSEIGNDK